MRTYYLIIIILLLLVCSCGGSEDNLVDENKLGFIDASVKSDETNLKEKAKYPNVVPGQGEAVNRAFENAPPMIPHTTQSFFPITIKNNICLACHMPDKVEATGAKEISKTHFMNWRPKAEEIDGKYTILDNEKLTNEKLDKLNNSYYNCSQCHAPQADIKVDIENLFTPEFRQEHGLENSNLDETVSEGIN